jgi:hypothetical protein
VLKESVKEVACRKPESPLKGGKHHDFLNVGCQDILPCGRPPLKHNAIREKLILN